jgi:hypothetical protein
VGFVGNLFRIGNTGAASIAIELPAVKGATDRVTHHPAASTRKMRTQVRAVGIKYRGVASFSAKQYEFVVKIFQGLDIAGLQLLRKTHYMPTPGKDTRTLEGVPVFFSLHCSILLEPRSPGARLLSH